MLKRTALLYRDSFSGLPLEIWWLSLVMLINRAGALVLPFLTVYLTEQLGFSLSKTGLIMSFYGLGSICGAYMGGKLTDRFGPFNVQFTSLFLSGLMFLVLMQLDTVQEFCVGIFFTSMIMDAFRPANMAAIGFYAPPELHTRAVALNRFAINLGFAMGPAMGGVLAGALGFGALFIFNAGAYVLAALVFRLTLRPPDRGAIPKDADGAPIAASTSPWQDYTFIKFVLCHFLGIFAFMQLFSTLPVYLKSTLGWGEDMIGYLIGLNGLLIVVIEMPMIFRLEKHPSKVWLAAIGAGFIFLGFLLLGLFSGLAF
ncbi:MAG: MFS transporter, partial [Bacteroidota bacterium]